MRKEGAVFKPAPGKIMFFKSFATRPVQAWRKTRDVQLVPDGEHFRLELETVSGSKLSGLLYPVRKELARIMLDAHQARRLSFMLTALLQDQPAEETVITELKEKSPSAPQDFSSGTGRNERLPEWERLRAFDQSQEIRLEVRNRSMLLVERPWPEPTPETAELSDFLPLREEAIVSYTISEKEILPDTRESILSVSESLVSGAAKPMQPEHSDAIRLRANRSTRNLINHMIEQYFSQNPDSTP